MLVAVNSCDVLAYSKRLFDVTLVIGPPQAPESPIIVYNEFLLTMMLALAVVRSPNNRLL